MLGVSLACNDSDFYPGTESRQMAKIIIPNDFKNRKKFNSFLHNNTSSARLNARLTLD